MRDARGWSIDQAQAAFADAGCDVAASTLYALERGNAVGGVDLQLEHVPAVARAYGLKTAAGWLPEE